MKAFVPCEKFQAHPDRPKSCFWCGWDEVPHLVPSDQEFEAFYWESIFEMDSPDVDD